MPHRLEETLSRGICIGCGACSIATNGAIPLTLGRFGIYSASIENVAEEDVRRGSSVCPFSDDALNEDQLGAPTEEGNSLPFDSTLGHYSRTLIGRHTSDDYLVGSSSGGLTSWLLTQLLTRNLVNGVIHVGRSDADDELFEYRISRDPQSVTAQRKSQYYATTLAEVLATARAQGGRFALVGVPCFIKAARLLCRQDESLNEAIGYFVGLVCGHMKTRFFAESLAWQVGVAPNELAAADFRLKNPERRSSDYDFGAMRRGTNEFVRQRTLSLVGGNWGHAAYQPEACNFCDDVFAETADVVFGDAWLPEFVDDWRGTNVVVTRNREIDAILDQGVAAGEIDVRPVAVGDAVQSQAGGLRHRRDGMAVRLADDIDAGLSVPKKRIAPSADTSVVSRANLIRQRRAMSVASLESFEEARDRGDLQIHLRSMAAEIEHYQRVDSGNFVQRCRAVAWRLRNSAREAWRRKRS